MNSDEMKQLLKVIQATDRHATNLEREWKMVWVSLFSRIVIDESPKSNLYRRRIRYRTSLRLTGKAKCRLHFTSVKFRSFLQIPSDMSLCAPSRPLFFDLLLHPRLEGFPPSIGNKISDSVITCLTFRKFLFHFADHFVNHSVLFSDITNYN